MPRSIQQHLLQVSLDDAAGCVHQARTAADRQAQEEHARITADLHRQSEELNAAIPKTERELRDLVKVFDARLAAIHQRARDIDSAIHAADARLESFLRDPLPGAS